MLREEIELVKRLAREIAAEEIAKALAKFEPPAAPKEVTLGPAKAAKASAKY